MSRFFLALGFVVFVSGCGSAVKLDGVPVEDKTGNVVAQSAVTASNADSGSIAKNSVVSVDIGNAGQNSGALAGPKVIYFDYDSFAIKPEYQTVIEIHARYVKADKSRKVSIEGHTDERGGREYNLALGQKRAEAVRRAMGLLGVSDAQIEAVSFGKEKPAVPGVDETTLAKNRRAEIAYR